MGVDCTVKLPHTARIADVAKVIGVLAGLPATLQPLASNAIYLQVEGIRPVPSAAGMPECPEIRWTDLDGQVRYCLFHYELSGGERGLYVPSTPFWCAVAVKLVDLFGGSVDFADCDSIDIDYQSSGNPLQTATDGEEWDQWQKAMLAVGQLTSRDIKDGGKSAPIPNKNGGDGRLTRHPCR